MADEENCEKAEASDSIVSFDVAISYASEDMEIAKGICDCLEQYNVKVFLYSKYESVLWGKDLAEELEAIYRSRSRYCLIISSNHYLQKKWTRFERRSALARAIADGTEYILPVRLDDTELPGLPDTIAYLDGRHKSVAEISELLLAKMGVTTEEGLKKIARETYGRLPFKVRCIECGERVSSDNIYICTKCPRLYCRHCVWNLPRPDDGLLSRWKCKCGGWLD